MAITWGSWSYASGNGMRLGFDVSWGSVTSASTQATATIGVYTEVQYNYSGDTQTITYSGDASGTTNYTNNQATGTQAYRGALTYNYTYATGSYGTSPGNKTYTGVISGTYNGSTPSVSVTTAVPARPGGVPTSPSVSASANVGSISVSWSATADPAVTAYNVYRNGSTSIYSGTGTSATDSVGNNVTAYYTMIATNAAGNSSTATSSTVTTPNVPTAPTSFAANTATFGQITLSWSAPSSNGGSAVTGYRLRTGLTVGAGTLLQDSTATSFVHTGLSPYTSYSYNITAYNAAGESVDTTSATLSATTMGGIARIWNGTAYVTALPQIWNGTAWVTAQARVWDATTSTWKYGI